jgi:hypothetical protein
MRELRLVAVSDDGTRLILEGNDSESQMTLPLDERVHAAIRGDRARLGQLEIQQDSKLRPRDIQARVRTGESVESVAAVSGMSLDKVQRYAGPVLAERQHVAERAQNAVIRRAGGEMQNRPLSEAVGEWVSRSDVDPESVQWDAWRRDDGKWQVVAAWQLGEDDAEAKFTFDPTGRSVLPDDDEARGVAGETPPAKHDPRPVPEPEVASSGPARLSVVEDPQPPHLEPVPSDPSGPYAPEPEPEPELEPAAANSVDDDQPTMPVPVTGRAPRPADARRLRNERRRKPRADEAADDRLRLTDIASKVEVDDEAASAAAQQPAKRASGARAKPAVPSWDEIMFGRRDKSD